VSAVSHQVSLPLDEVDFRARAISPFEEMGAYEALWAENSVTFKTLAKQFAENPGSVPSNFVSKEKARAYANLVRDRFAQTEVGRFGVRVNRAAEYPHKLRDATHPVELLYYAGRWDLVWSRSVAVVGSRKPTEDGLAQTKKLVSSLVNNNFTIVSGLAAGIDTIAHEAAIEQGGRTIAVLGTPLSKSYPKENATLQRFISENFLVISQVPVKHYEQQDYRKNRFFFPERNATMSALTEASVIVEAGETSGALIQARAALSQGRRLFILDNCFIKGLEWPAKFTAKGAIRVRDYDDISRCLSRASDED